MNPDEAVHAEEIRDAVDQIEQRIETVEQEKHLNLEKADVRVNAPRALMQAGGQGERRGLRFARRLLEDLGS